MSDEEKIKEIIKDIKIYINDYINESTDENGYTQYKIGEEEQEFFSKIETVTNLTTKLQKEIEHQKEKRENQKTELAILNEKQKDMNKLINDVKSYKGQFKRQEKQIKKLQKENEYLLKEKEENKFIIAMANNEMLGYNQGYLDGKSHNSNATEIIMQNRQNYIHKEEINLYKAKIESLKKENEELKHDNRILLDEEKNYIHTEQVHNNQIQQLKKQIDLMAEELSNIDFDKMCEECPCAVGYGCQANEDIDMYIDCIKQYFEKLAKEKGK